MCHVMQAYQQQLAQYHQSHLHEHPGMYIVQGVPHQDLHTVYQVSYCAKTSPLNILGALTCNKSVFLGTDISHLGCARENYRRYKLFKEG